MIAGAVIALAVATAARSSAVRQRVERALRESDRRRIGALVLAGSITAVWMLHAIQTDSSIAWAPGGVTANVAYTSDETFAVIVLVAIVKTSSVLPKATSGSARTYGHSVA